MYHYARRQELFCMLWTQEEPASATSSLHHFAALVMLNLYVMQPQALGMKIFLCFDDVSAYLSVFCKPGAVHTPG